MDTKEVTIDEDVMEMAIQNSKRTGRCVEEILDKYRHFVTDNRRLSDDVSPVFEELKAIQRRNRIVFGNAGDFDWKEELSNELYKKHIG